MDKLNFIFCNHPLYQRQVDMDYEEEYNCAKSNHSCALFSYEDLEKGKLSLYKDEITGLTIYRGWMMKPKMYELFYNMLKEKGIILINNPSEYERYHMLPNWYEDFKNDTIYSVWEDKGNIESAMSLTNNLDGAYSLIEKDNLIISLKKRENGNIQFEKKINDSNNTDTNITNTDNTDTNNNNNEGRRYYRKSNSGLSTGAIIGITIASVAVAAAIAITLALCLRKRTVSPITANSTVVANMNSRGYKV